MLREADLDAAVKALRSGQVIGLPTETVYGVACDARDPAAIARLYRLKGRPDGRPLPVLLPDASALSAWCAELPPGAALLAEAFWPGPLTLVLRRAAGLPDALTAGGDTLGLRVPRHPVALAVLRAFGGGLATPSANRHGEVSATDAASAREAFGGDLELVLDGGASELGVESTVVDLSGERPRLLRAGAIAADAVAAALGLPLVGPDASAQTTRFSVRTPVEIVAPQGLAARCGELGAAGQRFAALAPAATALPEGVTRVALPEDPSERARTFYEHLRRADALGLDRLLVVDPGESAWADAIRQRLRAVE
ncbi:MAG: threonylcarbamoyl-AMP synthase [Deltaproteobacteria bacterium]|nr:threonylcarbamoyl-AMP synthase [Deltaproteobacteria bacterium]MCB9788286.1 threonylcarbamoyl-AMP synthase [Deltaproteobacteria bacterium]